eukprot:8307538-Pyramimonas_sp.AAC.3
MAMWSPSRNLPSPSGACTAWASAAACSATHSASCACCTAPPTPASGKQLLDAHDRSINPLKHAYHDYSSSQTSSLSGVLRRRPAGALEVRVQTPLVAHQAVRRTTRPRCVRRRLQGARHAHP